VRWDDQSETWFNIFCTWIRSQTLVSGESLRLCFQRTMVTQYYSKLTNAKVVHNFSVAVNFYQIFNMHLLIYGMFFKCLLSACTYASSHVHLTQMQFVPLRACSAVWRWMLTELAATRTAVHFKVQPQKNYWNWSTLPKLLQNKNCRIFTVFSEYIWIWIVMYTVYCTYLKFMM